MSEMLTDDLAPLERGRQVLRRLHAAPAARRRRCGGALRSHRGAPRDHDLGARLEGPPRRPRGRGFSTGPRRSAARSLEALRQSGRDAIDAQPGTSAAGTAGGGTPRTHTRSRSGTAAPADGRGRGAVLREALAHRARLRRVAVRSRRARLSRRLQQRPARRALRIRRWCSAIQKQTAILATHTRYLHAAFSSTPSGSPRRCPRISTPASSSTPAARRTMWPGASRSWRPATGAAGHGACLSRDHRCRGGAHARARASRVIRGSSPSQSAARAGARWMRWMPAELAAAVARRRSSAIADPRGARSSRPPPFSSIPH